MSDPIRIEVSFGDGDHDVLTRWFRQQVRVLAGGNPRVRAEPQAATVAKGDVIRIIPERGPERRMLVAHVEHHLITLADLPETEEPPDGT